MKSLILNNKYDFLRNKLAVGEIVKPRLIKRISNNKAVANIKGYNVVIKNENLNAESSDTSFVILGFNDKEKLILLKKQIMSNIKYNEPNLNFIMELLKSKNIPVNSITINIANLLYQQFNSINKEMLFQILHLSKILNVPDFILFLLNSGISQDTIKYFLQRYKNGLLLLNLFNKKKYISDKNKKVNFVFDNFDDILELLKGNQITNKSLFNALLNIEDLSLFMLHLLLLNLGKEKNQIFFSFKDKEEETVRFNVKKEKNNWVIKIDYMINNENVVLKLYYNLMELNITVETMNKTIFNFFKAEKENLLQKLKKYIKNVSLEINGLKYKKNNFDIYV